MLVPISCRIGIAAATSASAPPIMIESLASRAPISPPDTGASTAPSPFAAAALAIRLASDGLEVVMSIKMVPGLACARMPPSPK
jgi:hypothetical protein